MHHSEAGAAGQMVGEHEPIAVGGGDPWATLRDPIIHFDIMMEALKGRGAPPQPDLRPAAQSNFYFSTAGPSPLVPASAQPDCLLVAYHCTVGTH